LTGATKFIDGKKFIRLPHKTYSPDVALSDVYLFGMLKERFKNCTTRTVDELKQEVDSIMSNIPELKLISVFQTWFKRSQQVIDSDVEYI
jgi:hypothetical protein